MKTFALGLMFAISVAQARASDAYGTEPRAEASRYPASTQQGQLKIGAQLLTAEQIRRAFATELNRNYLVVEVALFPGSAGPLEVSRMNFALRASGGDAASKPSNPRAVAAMTQQRSSEGRDVTVYPQVGIGYESGRTYDPVTGQERRGGGVYTSAGVGVGVGPRESAQTDKDREVMELELTEKGLPEGSANKPVAGYLYFPYPEKKKSEAYQLDCTLGGVKIALALKGNK
jgi:hypothetical protein